MTTPQAWLHWQDYRRNLIAGPAGFLALKQVVTIDTPMEVPGIPGIFVPVDGGLTIQAAASDRVFVDGQPVDGGVRLRSLDEPNPSLISFPNGHAKLETEFERFEVQHFDPALVAQSRFRDAERYSYDPAFVFTGRFRAEALRHEQIELLKGGELRGRVSGHLDVRIAGRDYSLFLFERSSYLLLGFADETTTRGETPRPGRFVRLQPVADGEAIVLDFNYATVMPCAFVDHYNCPVPRASNVIDLAITAGEKRPIERNAA